ncbi:MAG: hypothetical protein AAFR60_07300, partial [Pseudomonadota bacterium]
LPTPFDIASNRTVGRESKQTKLSAMGKTERRAVSKKWLSTVFAFDRVFGGSRAQAADNDAERDPHQERHRSAIGGSPKFQNIERLSLKLREVVRRQKRGAVKQPNAIARPKTPVHEHC